MILSPPTLLFSRVSISLWYFVSCAKSQDRSSWSTRGVANVGCLILLAAIIVGVFAGWPIAASITASRGTTLGAYNLGGINSTGQVPFIPGMPSLIDSDTPQSVMARTGFDGHPYELVFSDEFNKDGRTFWEGGEFSFF
jgi:hypothetical protein